MFNIGTPEIIIILIVALVLFGPKKLPEIGKALGQGIRELKKASREVVDAIERDDDEPVSSKENMHNAAGSGNRND